MSGKETEEVVEIIHQDCKLGNNYGLLFVCWTVYYHDYCCCYYCCYCYHYYYYYYYNYYCAGLRVKTRQLNNTTYHYFFLFGKVQILRNK